QGRPGARPVRAPGRRRHHRGARRAPRAHPAPDRHQGRPRRHRAAARERAEADRVIMAELALLWHLHQPDYRDPITRRPLMPFTRLHALRGYRDLMLESVEEGLAVTLNLVPVLVDQLLHYAEGGDDRHLELTRREARTLDPDEVAEVCRTFPVGHHAMSDAHPAYRRLRARVEAGHRPSTD